MTQTPTKRLTPDLTDSGTNITLQVTKRDGRVVEFEPARIQRAIEAAFVAEYADKTNAPLSDAQRTHIDNITKMVIAACSDQDRSGAVLEVEGVQDLVEEKLMRSGEFSVARRYIVYRQERNRARVLRMESVKQAADITVNKPDGTTEPLNTHLVKRRIYEACHGLPQCKPNELLQELYANLYNGITTTELEKAMVMVTRQHIETEPAYNKVATRLVLNIVYRQALGEVPAKQDHDAIYRVKFEEALKAGVEAELLNPELLTYDMAKLVAALKPERDETFTYLGAQTVYDRYLIHISKRRIETPQFFFMRVAMAWRCVKTRPSARPTRSSSTNCCPPSASSARRRRSLTPAHATPSSPRATSPRSTTTWATSSSASATTPRSRSGPEAWATTGPASARPAATSRGPTANRRASSPSSRSSTTPPSP